MSPNLRPESPLEGFPVALLLSGRRCVVAGSGEEAAHRARLLLAAGADVLVVARAAGDELIELGQSGRLRLLVRGLHDEDLKDAWLCIVAEADHTEAARIAALAEKRHIFCCAVDRPEHSSFIHMALARAGQLVVAISTAGQAPALARRLREELQRLFEAAGLERFVSQLAELRRRIEPGRRRAALAPIVERVRITGELELPELDHHSNAGAPGGPTIGSGGG